MVIGRGRRREHLTYENKRGQFPMAMGSGRRREHLIYENKKGGGNFLWLQGHGRRREHLLYENKREGVVSHGYRTRTSQRTPQPTFCTTTKKKPQGKTGMRIAYFRSWPLPDRASSGHVTDVTSGEKAPLGRILHNFGYACTEHTSGQGSGHVTSGHVVT